MKKFVMGLLVGLLVSVSMFAYAANEQIRLVVNGVDITNNFDAKPTIIDGRTMVPARPLAEALGAKVEWDAETRSVIVVSEDHAASNQQPEEETAGEWISLRDFVEKHGGNAIVSENIEIHYGNDRLIIPSPPISGQYVSENGKSISVRFESGSTYLNAADVRNWKEVI